MNNLLGKDIGNQVRTKKWDPMRDRDRMRYSGRVQLWDRLRMEYQLRDPHWTMAAQIEGAIG